MLNWYVQHLMVRVSQSRLFRSARLDQLCCWHAIQRSMCRSLRICHHVAGDARSVHSTSLYNQHCCSAQGTCFRRRAGCCVSWRNLRTARESRLHAFNHQPSTATNRQFHEPTVSSGVPLSACLTCMNGGIKSCWHVTNLLSFYRAGSSEVLSNRSQRLSASG